MKKLSIVPSPSETIGGFIFLAIELTVLQPILVLIVLMTGIEISDAALNFIYFALNFLIVTILFHNFIISSNGLFWSSRNWKSEKMKMFLKFMKTFLEIMKAFWEAYV